MKNEFGWQIMNILLILAMILMPLGIVLLWLANDEAVIVKLGYTVWMIVLMFVAMVLRMRIDNKGGNDEKRSKSNDD